MPRRPPTRWIAPLAALLIIVIPLLAESGTASEYDRVLVVDCDEALQRARLALVAATGQVLRNALGVLGVLLAPLLTIVWGMLNKMNAEPSIPRKFGLGLLFNGLSFTCDIAKV